MRTAKKDYIVSILVGHNPKITVSEVARALKRVEELNK